MTAAWIVNRTGHYQSVTFIVCTRCTTSDPKQKLFNILILTPHIIKKSELLSLFHSWGNRYVERERRRLWSVMMCVSVVLVQYSQGRSSLLSATETLRKLWHVQTRGAANLTQLSSSLWLWKVNSELTKRKPKQYKIQGGKLSSAIVGRE